MIPTYRPNLEYLTQSLRNVLLQDPGESGMQIALLDDASPDFDPRRFLDDLAAGRVESVKHLERLGLAGAWNACIEAARGEWIHILHQDDLALPGFYQRLKQGIDRTPSVGAAYCRDIVIDRKNREGRRQPLERAMPGILEEWLEPFFVDLRVRASAIVVKRTVYESLRSFDTGFEYATDWDMWKRIAVSYPIWYEPETLVCYRAHDQSATHAFLATAHNIEEIRLSIERSDALLPGDVASDVSRRARRNYTEHAVRLAVQRLLKGDLRSAVAHLRAATRLESGAEVVWSAARLVSNRMAQGR